MNRRGPYRHGEHSAQNACAYALLTEPDCGYLHPDAGNRAARHAADHGVRAALQMATNGRGAPSCAGNAHEGLVVLLTCDDGYRWWLEAAGTPAYGLYLLLPDGDLLRTVTVTRHESLRVPVKFGTRALMASGVVSSLDAIERLNHEPNETPGFESPDWIVHF